MATYVKYQQFNGDLGLGVHNLNTDTLKVMLSNTAPTVATDALRSDATEIGAGNGYTSGGDDITNTYSESGGVGTLAGTDVVFTASGGTIGPFRYAIVYNDTSVSPLDPLVCYWDYGSSITLNDTETFTVDFGASILTIT